MNSVQNTPTFSVDGAYIREWLILGPLPSNDMEVDFLTPAGGEENISRSEAGGDTIVTPQGASLTWQRYQTKGNIVDLRYHFRYALNARNAIAYLFCLLETEGEGAAEFYFANDGQAMVWLNSKPVHRWTTEGSFVLDAHVFEGVLRPGINHCLIKVARGEQTWEASLRGRKLPADRAAISGIVTNEAGTPIANAEVCLEHAMVQGDRAVTLTSRTDASGRYHINVSPVDGTYELSATWNELGDRHADIQFRPGEQRKLDLTSKQAVSVSGTLLMYDDLTPHVAVPVEAVSAETSAVVAIVLSDELGRYQFVNLKPGKYRVKCHTRDGYVYYRHADGEILPVEWGNPLKYIDFRFASFKKGSWKNYTFFDGLVHNRVRAIHRAPDGVMWFGTEGGLSRFDGKVFVNFTTQDGLTNNEINVICGTPDGDIWFGTNGGVSRYDGKQFVTFTQKDGLANNRVRAIYRAPDGVMWFGTEGGVSRYDGHWFVTFTQKDGLAGNIVNHICSTPDGMMWFAMGRGVSRYDGEVFVTLTTKDGLAHNRVYVISRDLNGVMWFGTHGGGVSRYDGKAFVTLTTQDGLANNWVYAIQSTPDGVLWFGTDSGVSRFDGGCPPKAGRFVNFTVQDSLVCNLVRAIHRDPDGALWFGTSRGASRYEGADSAGPMGFINFTTQDGLANNGVYVIYQDSDDTLWIGTHEGGVSRYDGKQFVTFTTKDGLAHNRVYAIHRDPDGVLWFGTDGGVSRYDGKMFVNFTKKDGLAGNCIGSIHRQPDGTLWFGTNRGVSRYDGKRFVPLTTTDGLAHPDVTAIYRASDGALWFGTRGGVSRYDGKGFINFTQQDGLVDNRVEAIYGTPDGTLWLGTQGGLSRYDGSLTPGPSPSGRGGHFVNFTTRDGLADGYIVAICRDREAVLWFGTLEGGAVCYDGVAWSSLDTRDGLPDNAVLSIQQVPDDSLWFGTGGGLTRYRKDKTRPRARLVAVIAKQRHTDFTALPPVFVGERITFEYTSIDFKTHHTKRQYRHRIYERPTTREHASKQDAEMQDSRFKIPPESCILNPVSYGPPTKQTTFEWIPQEAGTYLFEV